MASGESDPRRPTVPTEPGKLRAPKEEVGRRKELQAESARLLDVTRGEPLRWRITEIARNLICSHRHHRAIVRELRVRVRCVAASSCSVWQWLSALRRKRPQAVIRTAPCGWLFR